MAQRSPDQPSRLCDVVRTDITRVKRFGAWKWTASSTCRQRLLMPTTTPTKQCMKRNYAYGEYARVFVQAGRLNGHCKQSLSMPHWMLLDTSSSPYTVWRTEPWNALHMNRAHDHHPDPWFVLKIPWTAHQSALVVQESFLRGQPLGSQCFGRLSSHY